MNKLMNNKNIGLFHIEFDTWHDICQIYFSNDKITKNLKSSYLQWYPFVMLSQEDVDYISSEDFYLKYIKNGAFLLFEENRLRLKNYITKNDCSFRDATMVSPILFLVLQCIGKEISKLYIIERKEDIDVFYGGNYKLLQPYYKNEYKRFLNCIDNYSSEYKYFIKTDLSSFFKSINVNLLIDRIANNSNNKLDQNCLSVIKEFLLYCGNNRFPLIENSLASSFLSTVIYLDEIDCKIDSFISSIEEVTKYKIVRYVDDMYILFTSKEKDKVDIYNQIISKYSTILKESNLSLNLNKCLVDSISKIDKAIKKSIYDDEYTRLNLHRDSISFDLLDDFFKEVSKSAKNHELTSGLYNELIENCFKTDNVDLTWTEIYNYFVYSKNEIPKSSKVIKHLSDLLDNYHYFLNFDPKRLAILILKTNDGDLIKKFLHVMLTIGSKQKFNAYDIISAITYLMQTHFSHNNLITLLNEQVDIFSSYYSNFCNKSFKLVFDNKKINKIVDIIGNEKLPLLLFYMYFISDGKQNHIAKLNYYKNFFISLSAIIDSKIKKNNSKEILYSDFENIDKLKALYKDSKISAEIIDKLNNTNNGVSLSKMLLSNQLTLKEINKLILQVKQLSEEKIKNL